MASADTRPSGSVERTSGGVHEPEREGRHVALAAVFEADFGQRPAISVLERRLEDGDVGERASSHARLIVEAVAESASIRAVIAGDGPELDNLRLLAKQLDVEKRIQFVGALSDEELLDHYARAAVIYFAPVREDYGFVTIEAFMSRKPVLTCHDSGGVTELVRDDVNGALVEPTKEAVAARLETLVSDPKKCQKLGDAAFDFATGLTWENTVKTLLGESR